MEESGKHSNCRTDAGSVSVARPAVAVAYQATAPDLIPAPSRGSLRGQAIIVQYSARFCQERYKERRTYVTDESGP